MDEYTVLIRYNINTSNTPNMTYTTPKNPNYVATVIRVAALEPLDGLDNLVGLRAFGMQALVSKDTKVGDIGVLFSTEVQLSEAFCRANNLFRHQGLNSNNTKKGYLDDNRRVKAIKLRGHRSDSLFVGLESFSYLGININDFTVGDVFDTIDGNEICRKYVIREEKATGAKNQTPKIRKVDEKNFPLHFDTDNFWRNLQKIPVGARVILTQKLHGTSIRFGRVQATRDLTWKDKIAKFFGIPVQETESKFVVGSRTVVKSLDGQIDDSKNHFYAEDEWTKYLYNTTIPDVIPEGFVVYGELIGWTSTGAPIQKNYTYNLPVGQTELYVYRVAVVVNGRSVDLPWEQVKRFCKDTGMKHVPELWSMDVTDHRDFEANINALMDLRYNEMLWEQGYTEPNPTTNNPMVPLSNQDTVDEGVCIRYEGENGPYVLKAKSPIFLGHESKLLDTGAEDIESGESVPVV